MKRDGPAPTPLPWPLAWRLAAGQILSWGLIYYAFTVVVGPMEAETGWSRTFLNAGLSLGLLVWGAGALPVGAWIQRRGGRGPMTAGAVLGGAGLALLGLAHHPAVYLGAWVLLGLAMAGLLYEPAFAVLTAAFGPEYRRGITLVTLVGGLASTVFIPLAQFAVDAFGWRDALIALGLAQIVVGVPLHAWGMPQVAPRRRDPGTMPPASARLRTWWVALRAEMLDPRFVGLSIWFTAHSAAFTGLFFLLVPILQALAVPKAAMLQAIMVIGPMQVLGRFLLTVNRRSFSALRIGRWAVAGVALGVAILLVLPARLPWLVLFAVCFGASNGIMTILRGTVIAELFGRDRYAELSGALSVPAVLARAGAPLAFAALWSSTGQPRMVFAGALAALVVGSTGLALATVAQNEAGRDLATPPRPCT